MLMDTNLFLPLVGFKIIIFFGNTFYLYYNNYNLFWINGINFYINVIPILYFISNFSNNVFIKNKAIFNKNKHYNLTCPICLDEFKDNDLIYSFKCNHIGHYNCILNMIKHNNQKKIETKCPFCRN